MIIPTHLANPFGMTVEMLTTRLPYGGLDLWFTKTSSKVDSMLCGQCHSEQEAIDHHNKLFSSAPIQYTDKGKVCE